MDPRLPNRNRRGLPEAGQSSSFHGRNRNDQYQYQRQYSNRDYSGASTSKQNNYQKKWYPKDDRDGRHFKGNYQELSRSNSVSSESSSLRLTESGRFVPYVCPNCKVPYNYFLSNNTICGKVPRILPCKHTVCEECIKKCFKTTNHVQCVICLKTEFDQKQQCDYNHYVLGQLTSSKFSRSTVDMPNIALVATDSKTRLSLTSNKSASVDPKVKCGFKDCSKPGAVSCVNCSGIYCTNCDDALHNSGRQLKSHKRVPINKTTFELNKCPDHSMFEEIYCKDCDETSCCYCVLEKHEGHSRTYLARLGAEEEKELLKAYDVAKLKRDHLLISQKKISKSEESEKESDLDVEIAQRFADLHARLYYIEKQLYQEAKLIKNGRSNLTELNEGIESNIEKLNYMLNCVDERENVKFNLRMLLGELKQMEDLPAVLKSSESSGASKLLIDEKIDNLENFFKLDAHSEVTFSLENVEELPEEYQVEVPLPKISSAQSKSSSDSEMRNTRPKQNTGIRDININKQQPVYLTHINSLESFYVQFKEMDDLFQQLEKEIANHVKRTKMGVSKVELKELYLGRRVCDQNRWCRVRVLEEIDEDIIYRVKFIDFGNTTSLGKDEMINVSSSLAKKKPFAYECRLYNPTEIEWPKDTHLELAKLLDVNKELAMFIKECTNNLYTVELNINTSAGGLCSVTDLLIFGCDAFKKKSITEIVIYDNGDVYFVGSSYEVYIRYILDPWHIYVQRASYENTFNSLIKNMEEYYKNSRCDIHIPVLNSYVVVNHKIKDFGNWHRARILKIFEDKKVVTVYLLDFGKCLRVSWKDIRKLALLFIKSECLVVCVKLADVSPLMADNWSDEFGASNYLEKYSQRNLKIKMLVSNDDPLEVVLFETEDTYDININTLLVEQELALSTGKLSCTKMWMHKDEEVIKEQSNLLFIKDDTDDEEIEENIQGIKLQIEMVQFDDPSSFYVSFMYQKKKTEKLHEELQIHYRSQKNYRTDRNWKVDEKLVVFDSSDRMYYRGIIQSIEGDKYYVSLLDRPDYLCVDSGKMRCITSYFTHNFPNTVFKCNLANIKPAGDSSKWSKLSVEWFQSLFMKHEEIYVQKIGDDESRSSLPVTMWYSKIIQGTALEPCRRNYVSIDKKVVKAGLAFWVNNEIPINQSPAKQKPTDQADVNDECNASVAPKTDLPETNIDISNREIKAVNVTEWLPANKIESREFFAYITCAENEGYLYIRDDATQRIYNAMEKNITNLLNTIERSDDFTLRPNQMVMVRSEGNWYRGTVLSVISNCQAKIIMVDFGSDHIVDKEDIFDKIMYPDMPILVSKIKLYNVHSKNKTWTDDEVEILLNTAPSHARIVIQSSLNDLIPLADVYDEAGFCLNDKLVELSPGLFRITPKEATKPEMLVKKEPQSNLEEKPEIHTQTDENEVKPMVKDVQTEIETVNPQVEGFAQTEEGSSTIEVKKVKTEEKRLRFKDMTLEDGCSHGDSQEATNEDAGEPSHEDANEELNEVPLKIKVVDSLELVDKEWPPMERYTYAPIENKMTEMEIIATYDYKTISLYNPDDESKEEDFETLTNEIRSNEANLQPLEGVRNGLPCLCLFEEDSQWYRAKIIRVDAQHLGYVTVIYVDYGNFEIVKISNLRTIRSEWIHFPARFVEASIDYCLVNSEQEDVLKKHIQSLTGETKYINVTLNYPLRVHVYNKEDDTFVLHYDAFVKNGIVQI